MEKQRSGHESGQACMECASASAGSRAWRWLWMTAVWAALAAGALCCLLAARSAQAAEVVQAEFGIFIPHEAGAEDGLMFEPTRVVPHKIGTRYGWAIELRTDKRRVSVREEYLLPVTARNGHENGHGGTAQSVPVTAGAKTRTLAFERRNTVSQRQLAPRNGLIFGEWEIGPGEPPGRRHLQVIVEGELAADFEYEVRATP